MTENDKIEILKDILFTEDRADIEKIAKRIAQLEKTLNQKKELTEKVTPILDTKLAEFTESMPQKLGPTITATLKEQISTQKDEVVDALFPILGKMIKKYIAQEIKLVTEKIDNQFSFVSRLKLRLRSLFSGKKERELILQELTPAYIEQVFLIEKDSGLLKASYSKRKTIDEDMISGMLTAIKSFVEDAFNKKGEQLELIEYELYQIQLQSFVTHYIAIVVSGNFSTKAKSKLQDRVFNFYNRFMAMNVDLVVTGLNMEGVGKVAPRSKIERELSSTFGDAKL